MEEEGGEGGAMIGREADVDNGIAMGISYPTIQPAKQVELSQLKRTAEKTTKAWMGDMLGAAKKGEMMARLM